MLNLGLRYEMATVPLIRKSNTNLYNLTDPAPLREALAGCAATGLTFTIPHAATSHPGSNSPGTLRQCSQKQDSGAGDSAV